MPQDDPKQRKPDITKAKKILKWEPKVPLEKGLDKTIAYFRDLLGDELPAAEFGDERQVDARAHRVNVVKMCINLRPAAGLDSA